MKPMRMGVIGCGYWGPNHIRNFSQLADKNVEMAVAADREEPRRSKIASLYPWVTLVREADEVIEDSSIDAVVVATPVNTHYTLARKALLAGKHVLVEKPFVTSNDEAEDLIRIADDNKLTLMVGHTFEYTAAVNTVRDLLAAGTIGDVMYVRSLRVNLGLYQKDINVIWDLAPHDVSILLYALQRDPTAVSAVGNAHITRGIEDVAVITLQFGESVMANITVSWLDPRKIREMTIVGSKQMLVYDDISANEKIRIFDKGVVGPRDYNSFGEFAYSYRYGDIVTPMINDYEPLRAECGHFVDSIREGSEARSSGRVGAKVVRILCAAQESLKQGGIKIPL